MSGIAIKGSVPVRNFDAVYIASRVIDNLTHNCKDTDGHTMNFNTCMLGSTGKKKDDEYSGDIDIAVELEFSDNNINAIENCIRNKICPAFSDNKPQIKVSSGFHIISFGVKWISDVVQVDLMFSNDIEYSKFMYHSPDYRNNESNFKGLYRTNLLIDLASFIPTNIPDVYNDEHVLTDFWKYTLTYDKGLFLRHKTYKGKRGLLKNPVTVKEDDKFITNDINEIIKFILGETATFTDTNSFETLIDFVFSKNYKYDNTVIFNVLKEYLNDKRHKDKILDIISYINKAIVNWLDDSNKELYISCLTESLLKEIIFIKNYVKD